MLKTVKQFNVALSCQRQFRFKIFDSVFLPELLYGIVSFVY